MPYQSPQFQASRSVYFLPLQVLLAGCGRFLLSGASPRCRAGAMDSNSAPSAPRS